MIKTEISKLETKTLKRLKISFVEFGYKNLIYDFINYKLLRIENFIKNTIYFKIEVSEKRKKNI